MSNKVEIKRLYPLSPMQEGMLFHNLIDKELSAYFEQALFTIRGDLDFEIFEDSFNLLIEKYDILRTIFNYEKFSSPMQAVLKERRGKIFFEDITELEDRDKDLYIQEFCRKDKKRGFDLTKDLLMRISVFKTDNNIYRVIWSHHHILIDGWCLGIIIGDYFNIYQQLKQNSFIKVENTYEYVDYINWLQKQDKNEAIEYWERYLDNYNNCAEIPKKSNEKLKDCTRKELSATINSKLANKINYFANAHNTTLNVIFEIAFGILLQKYSDTKDVVFGAVVSGRNPEVKGIEKMVGLFINTIPVRITCNDLLTIRELVEDLRKRNIESMKYDYLPLAEIQSKTTQKQKLISHILVFENYPLNGEIKNINDSLHSGFFIENFNIREQTNYDLDLTVVPGNEIEMRISYNTCVYDESFVDSMKIHLLNILNFIVDNPLALVKDIDIISEDERIKLLNIFNDTYLEYPQNKLIHELFEEQVEKTPENIAVVYNNEVLTYNELNSKANRLARTLRKEGVKANSIVGIMVDRSVEMIIGIIAILKAGGAYIPIDPNYPKDRINYMLLDSKASILITQKNFAIEMNLNCKLLDIYDLQNYSEYENNLDIINNSNDLAYIIYTSGTTGNPKGVMVEHKNLVNISFSWRKHYNLDKFKVNLLQMASISFDVFAGDFCRSLHNGGTMYICSDDVKFDMQRLYDSLIEHKINIFESTPSLIFTFMDFVYENDLALDYLNLLILGSDSCPMDKYRELIKNYSNKIRIINSYGITEATIDSSYYEETIENIPNITNTPIGKPLSNIKFYILNKSFQLQPVGIPGELYIAGDGLARGYFNNVELTNYKFLQSPFVEGTKMYRTGDIAKWLEDGNVEFLGREDNQVKIRGFRIELGEIEKRLLEVKGIKQVVVIDMEDSNRVKHLCAYIVSTFQIQVEELRSLLSENLPEYMIPSNFIFIDEMPLTPNGKIDRKGLAELNLNLVADEYEAPRNEKEELLSRIWSQLLGVEKVGINDNFFELGGDSIKAIQIISRVRKQGYSLEIKDLFKNPNISELAKLLKEGRIVSEQNVIKGKVELTPIQRWFFNEKFLRENHWNQSIMLYNKQGFEEEALRKVFEKIAIHHDILRAIYKMKENTIVQNIRDVDGELCSITIHDLVEKENYKEEIVDICNNIQSSIDLTRGPLVKLGLFKTREGHYLLIAIHHLVIDGVSWRILIEDFSIGYRQALCNDEIRFENKTSSFKEWARRLKEYGSSKEILREKKYWKSIEDTYIKPLPKLHANDEGCVNCTKHISVKISRNETEQLLKGANMAYNTEINDLLLAALGLSIKEWNNTNNILINLERHGREELFKDIDITRTIGWFTTEYPVILDMEKSNDLSYQIKLIKENLKRVPNKGIGYGILKYLTEDELKKDIEFRLKPEISFNYLGQVDKDIEIDLFQMSQLSTGENVSEENKVNGQVVINGIVINEELNFTFTFNANEFEKKDINELANAYIRSLTVIIQHCMSKQEAEVTPTDLGDKELSIDELDYIMNNII